MLLTMIFIIVVEQKGEPKFFTTYHSLYVKNNFMLKNERE